MRIILSFLLLITCSEEDDLYTIGCTDHERNLIEIAIEKANQHYHNSDIILMDSVDKDLGWDMDTVTCVHSGEGFFGEKRGNARMSGYEKAGDIFVDFTMIRTDRMKTIIILHEIGHYLGHEHTTNKHSPMYWKPTELNW